MQLFIEFFRDSGSTLVGRDNIVNFMEKALESFIKDLNDNNVDALAVMDTVVNQNYRRVNLGPLGSAFKEVNIATPHAIASSIMLNREYSKQHFILPFTYTVETKTVYDVLVQRPST